MFGNSNGSTGSMELNLKGWGEKKKKCCGSEVKYCKSTCYMNFTNFPHGLYAACHLLLKQQQFTLSFFIPTISNPTVLIIIIIQCFILSKQVSLSIQCCNLHHHNNKQ